MTDARGQGGREAGKQGSKEAEGRGSAVSSVPKSVFICVHLWFQSVLLSFLLAGVRLYQVGLRPLNPWGCKFHPSCSQYALEAIAQHGLTRGLGLALARLLRCRPGVFGGYDPVPAGPEPGR